ncbi:MAG: hypothetical protein LAO03_22810 [Acidobacteriia bacterium]|jgi:hypothetical protein|nr:hypothetical protein [Terriglobia bacterium]
MNRFLLKPNLKPEFKMAQPLPPYLSLFAAQPEPAGAPATRALSWRPENQRDRLMASRQETFAIAGSNVAS